MESSQTYSNINFSKVAIADQIPYWNLMRNYNIAVSHVFRGLEFGQAGWSVEPFKEPLGLLGALGAPRSP